MPYNRDKRSPIPKNATVSKVMSANKGKNSKPELALRKALFRSGIRGYRIHFKKIEGNPDIAWVGRRKVLFVHGCFWHRCPRCAYPLPRTNQDYWRTKFERNVARDRLHLRNLEQAEWKVLIVWECEIQQSLQKAVQCVKDFLDSDFR